MRFLIISHALHKAQGKNIFSYAPYVREMNLWLKHVDEVEVIAPLEKSTVSNIDLAYKHTNFRLTKIPAIAFTSIKNTTVSVFKIPVILFKIFKACKKSEHIHLRCPGNIGLLGCFVQIFFPNTSKTVKYAGNWDPKAEQPLSYRFQKWLLSNTVLTKNISVLVYGDWESQGKNIKPFFTATFNTDEIEPIEIRNYSEALQFVFVGSLVEGKRPLLTIQIVESLHQKGMDVSLNIFGEGGLRKELESYVENKNLNQIVRFRGNQEKELVKQTLKKAHFLILPSKSEGWPKAIAEAMFFGVIPIATPVSCVPDMLGFGKRGVLIEPRLGAIVTEIERNLSNTENLKQMSQNAANWSQNYTLEKFETEITKLLKP